MQYQIALKLHKLINDHNNVLSFEHVTVMDQIISTSWQINFQILRNCNSKMGMNTTANKLYHLHNQIGRKHVKFELCPLQKIS